MACLPERRSRGGISDTGERYKTKQGLGRMVTVFLLTFSWAGFDFGAGPRPLPKNGVITGCESFRFGQTDADDAHATIP